MCSAAALAPVQTPDDALAAPPAHAIQSKTSKGLTEIASKWLGVDAYGLARVPRPFGRGLRQFNGVNVRSQPDDALYMIRD